MGKIKSAASRKIKSGLEKANPIDKPINKNDTTDTGIESIRLGYRTTKKTYKTAKKTVRTGQLLYKSPGKAVRIIKGTVKFASSLVIHTAAILLNPLLWILLFILFVIVVLILPFVLMLGGGAGGGTTTNVAYGTAAGVKDELPAAFAEAEEFYRIACENKQNDFNAMIDSMYFSTDDLSHSDMVYMECSSDSTVFQSSLATDNRKQQLKDKFSNSLSKTEAIALVYVYLEKQENDANDTEGEIYEIEFTQEAFDDLLSMMISWTENVYGGQECPQRNCSVHRDEIPNPQYDEAAYRVNMAAGAFNDWGNIIPLLERYNSIGDGRAQAQFWNNNIADLISDWNYVYGDFVPAYPDYSRNGENFLDYLGSLYEGYAAELESTPPTITEITTTCDHLHNLHSIGLNIMTKEDVMTAWNFSDIYKEWVEITYLGFQNNPDIQAPP